MTSQKISTSHLETDTLRQGDTSRFQLRSGQNHVLRDGDDEVGVQALHQIQPGIVLRVLDITMRTDLTLETTASENQLMFGFKLAGDNVVESVEAGGYLVSEGSLFVAYSGTRVIIKDNFDKDQRYLLVMLLCDPEILLQAPFDLEAEQLPDVIQSVLHDEKSLIDGCSMNAELIQALRILLNSDTGDALNRAFLQAKSIEILCLALRNILQHESQREQSKISERERLKMGEAHQLLKQRWQDPPTQEELVQALGIGKSRLKKCFKWLYGLSIKDYVLGIRMQQAQQLLTEGRLNVSQVAMEVGYEHPCNFVTAFKRKFGMTPKAFQKASSTGYSPVL